MTAKLAPVLAPDQANRLGCAQDYEAVVHFQGGKQVHTRLDTCTEIKWGRKLDDFSEASVKLAKREMSAECWRKLGGVWDVENRPDANGVMRKWLHQREPGVEPWAHELSIYRDKGLVWQGPITEVIETRGEIEIQARDMLFWLDRRVLDITFYTEGTPIPPNDPGAQVLPRDSGEVCRKVMERTFPVYGDRPENSNVPPQLIGAPDPYNNPNMRDLRAESFHNWDIRPTPNQYTANKYIWKGSQTVGDLIRDVIKTGIDMFTMGRRIYMIPDFDRADPARRSPYRLTDEHFLDDLEIHKLGLDLATEGFVISNPESSTSATNNNNPPPFYGKFPCEECGGGSDCPPTPAWYGRITRFDESQNRGPGGTENNPDPPIYCQDWTDNGQRRGSLQEAARAIYEYGWPCPKSVVVPDGATLAPETPLHINQLVPGRGFLVEMTGWTTPISEIFRLNEVEVTWTSPGSSGGSQGGAGGSGSGGGGAGGGQSNGPEKVQISLATTRAPAPIDDTGGIIE